MNSRPAKIDNMTQSGDNNDKVTKLHQLLLNSNQWTPPIETSLCDIY